MRPAYEAEPLIIVPCSLFYPSRSALSGREALEIVALSGREALEVAALS
jgi:hypothetical protein